VAIYLDTNVLYGWRTFAELRRLALSIVAAQIGQAIVLPSLVVEEAEAQYRRELESAVESFESAERAITRLFGTEYVHVEPVPWPEDQIATWRRRLREWCEVMDIHPGDAAAALSREVVGAPPAKPRVPKKPGIGARDAAIWLTIVRHHLSRDEDGHFVTANHTDFLRGDDLKPELLADLGDAARPIYVYADVDGLLARLGEPSDDKPVDVQDLKALALPAIRESLEDSLVVPLAVFSEVEGRRYRTEVLDGEPLETLRTRHYARGRESVTLVNAKWELTVRCMYQDADTESRDEWYVVRDLDVEGQIQVFLPEANGEHQTGQFIAAQLQSKTTVSITDRGLLFMTQRSLDEERE
jgi:PIN domain